MAKSEILFGAPVSVRINYRLEMEFLFRPAYSRERKIMKGAEVLVQMLLEYKVEVIFGVPGDTSLALYEAIYDAAPKIRHVMARDERSAGFMADAYARISFKPGICECPSGAGALYSVPGRGGGQRFLHPGDSLHFRHLPGRRGQGGDHRPRPSQALRTHHQMVQLPQTDRQDSRRRSDGPSA